jgi:NADH-quinone oxidoreductase subunit J
MVTQATLLTILGGVTLVSSLFALLTTHPVYAVFFLLSTFLTLSLFLLVAGVTFFGFIYLIIYAGAIAIVFLFIIMSLDLTVQNRLRVTALGGQGTLLVLFFGLLGELAFLLGESYVPLSFSWLTTTTLHSSLPLAVASGTDFPLGALVTALYTGGSAAFLVSGFILLVGMVGAIVLTLDQRGGVTEEFTYFVEENAESLYKEGYHNS